MEIDSGQIQSKATGLHQSNVEFFADINFKDFLIESEKNPIPEKKVIKVANQHYQIELDNDSYESDNDVVKKSVDLQTKSDETLSKRAEHSDGAKDHQQEQNAPTQSQTNGIHPGLTFAMKIVSPKEFIDSLPKSLKGFIEETVEIIKKQSLGFGDSEYLFKFKELNLDVSIKSEKNVLKIDVTFGDSDLKDSTFNKENQQLLINALQQEFPDDEIVVQFIDAFESEFKHKKDQPSDGGSQNQEKETTDEDATT